MHRKNSKAIEKYCVLCQKTWGQYMAKCCTNNSLIIIYKYGFFNKKIKYFDLEGYELSENDVSNIREREKRAPCKKSKNVQLSVTQPNETKKLLETKPKTPHFSKILEEKANNYIENAVIAAIIIGMLEFIVPFFPTYIKDLVFNLFNVDSLWIIALAVIFGRDKGRITSFLLIIYFLITEIIMFVKIRSPKMIDLVIVPIFLYFFIKGVYGAFIYQEYKGLNDIFD